MANMRCSEEEDPDDYPFPLTLKTKKPTGSGAMSPAINGGDGSSDIAGIPGKSAVPAHSAANTTLPARPAA